MSYTEQDAQMDRYYDDLRRQFEDGLESKAKDAVKSYLGANGDAVDKRVLDSIGESKALLKYGHFGPALCSAAIATELMIRFMLVRPLIQGAFLSDEWAGILTARIATGETARDRELVPVVLKQWGLDVTTLRGAVSNAPVWEFTVTQLFPHRNNYVHRYDPVPEKIAIVGVECVEAFRYEVVGAVARQIGFTLEVTGEWCKIVHPREVTALGGTISEWTEDFERADPFARVSRGNRP